MKSPQKTVSIGIVAVIVGCVLWVLFYNKPTAPPSEEQVKTLIAEAQRDSEENNLAEAIKKYDEALRLDPNNPRILLWRGQAKARTEDPHGAIADFSEAIRRDILFIEAYASRASTRFAIRQYDLVIEDCDEIIRLDPKITYSYLLRSRSLLRKGLNSDAVTDASRAIEMGNRSPQAYTIRAVAYQRLSDWEGAISDYTEALAIDPSTDGYLMRAWAKFYRGDFDGSLADCNEAIQVLPSIPEAYKLRGCVRYIKREWSEIPSELQKSLEDSTDGSDLRYARLFEWLTMARSGRKELGNTLIEKAVEAWSSKEKDKWANKIALYLIGKLDEDTLLQEAKTLEADAFWFPELESLFYIANKHLSEGRRDVAFKIFQQCIDPRWQSDWEYVCSAVELQHFLCGAFFIAVPFSREGDPTWGLVVSTLDKNSGTERAGLMVKDVVLKINSEPATWKSLALQLSKAKAGDRWELQIVRKGDESKLFLTLGD